MLYFKAKLALKSIHSIELDRAVRNALPYWQNSEDSDAQFILNVNTDDKTLSETILKSMVAKRRQKEMILEEVSALRKSYQSILFQA